MRNKIELGHYNNLTVHTITNLYLYGTLETPAREDRIRSEEQYRNPPTVSLDMGPFMTEGPGRYAHASMAPFVQQFFDAEHPVSLPDGRYTKEELINRFNYTEGDFRFNFKHTDIDHRSTDYAERVYIYNSTAFETSDNAVFVINTHGSIKYVENMAVHPLSDNFDFQTANRTWKDEVVQLGNDIVLKREIDPDNIGRTVEIEYGHKENVPVIERYTALNFLSEQVATARENSGTLAHAYFPMREVIKELQEHGTIEPVESREEGVEYISDGGTIMPSESADTHDIRAIPVFKPDGHPVEYIPEGGTIMPSEPAGTHNFRAVPLPHFKPEEHPEAPRDTTVFETLSATHTMAVPVYDSGEREKEKERDDVGSSSGQQTYVPSVSSHDYKTLFEPYKNDMNLGERKRLIQDILAFEQERGSPLSQREIERVVANAVMPDLINSKYFSIIYNHSTSQPSSHPQVSWR